MQEKACREYCEREGYDVAGIFVDEGESAKTIDRPKFKELLGFCRNKKNRVNVVVVNSISRFARDKYSHFTVNFATNALGNAAAFWIQCSADQKQRFQKVLFPDGLIFDRESYRTAETCLVFSYLREISEGNSSLASRTGIEPVSPP